MHLGGHPGSLWVSKAWLTLHERGQVSQGRTTAHMCVCEHVGHACSGSHTLMKRQKHTTIPGNVKSLVCTTVLR